MSEPHVWLNKISNQICVATPYWVPYEIKYDEKFYESILPEFKAMLGGRKIASGQLLQDGWCIQNQHGIHFVVSLGTEKQFIDLGEL